MSNVLTFPVYAIDTAATIIAADQPVKLNGVRWVGSVTTSAGHIVHITDGRGNTVWRSVATGAYYVEADTPAIRGFNGLIVATISSGTLYLEMG